jgi:hypothetical protein
MDSPIVALNSTEDEFWAAMWWENYAEELAKLD